MALSRDQFGEVSRAGKRKKAYATQQEADVVAGMHKKKYGTVARSYQGRDRQWYVATDREATASNNVASEMRARAERRSALLAPVIAHDRVTRKEIHVGTVVGEEMRIAAMNPDNPRHPQFIDWVARVNRNRPALRGER